MPIVNIFIETIKGFRWILYTLFPISITKYLSLEVVIKMKLGITKMICNSNDKNMCLTTILIVSNWEFLDTQNNQTSTTFLFFQQSGATGNRTWGLDN